MSFVTIKSEYIWNHNNSLKSKTKFLNFKKEDDPNWKIDLEDMPLLPIFLDAEETEEAVLRPVFACIDPNRKNSILVLCDVLDLEFTPHHSNTRARMLDSFVKVYSNEPLIAFDQEYVLSKGDSLIAPIQEGEYCDANESSYQARMVGELHTNSCLSSQLMVESFSAKYAPSVWSYRIGGVNSNPVSVCDQLLVSRFLLKRAAESNGYSVFKNDTLYAGKLHITYSDLKMRKPNSEGLTYINEAESILIAKGHDIRVSWETKRQGFGSLTVMSFKCNDDPYIILNTIFSNLGSYYGL